MSADKAPVMRPESRSRVAWLVASLTLLALLLRFWHLRDWSFQATEMFTLRDSDEPQFKNPRPLGYLLNYYLVRPLLPLDEFGLRLLPALFGVLAVPVLFLVARRLVGTGAGLFSALLLAVSPLHLLYSQLARYWSLVFLLSAVYPYALYLGVREQRVGMLVLGMVTAILAALAHPVSILLLGGPALWLLMSYLRPSLLKELWSRKSFRWGALAAVLIGLIVAARFVPILHSWITQHDQNPGSGQFLLRTPAAPGLKQILYVMAYLESLTFPVAIGAVVGTYLLWWERERNLTIFLVNVAVFPIVFLALLSLRTPVSQYYLLPTAPAFFLAAGVFLDRVTRIEWAVRPRWLLPAALTLIFVASAAPTLISDLRDGRRYNFRGVARWLKPQVTPADVVFSDQYMVMTYYLPGTEVRRLRTTAALEEAWQDLQRQERPGALWIVAPAPSHPFRTNLRRGGLINWIHLHCQLRYLRGVGRVDLRQHYLQVYRCPPIPPLTGGRAEADGVRF
jgi:hypothetical protein